MNISFKKFKNLGLVIALFFCGMVGYTQADTEIFKFQIATGVNHPMADGFVSNFEAKTINFPTINLGLQYMFFKRFGAKLDLGYNRFSNKKDTPEFKTNYTRLNAQLVYDASRFANLVSPRLGVFAHAGPGYSMIKPLGDYGDNKTNFLNAMGGLEFHYGINDGLTMYLDGSYIYGFGKEFSPVSNGYGSFNGGMLTVTVGLSMSLTGCYFCND